jgi:hypothetical protein
LVKEAVADVIKVMSETADITSIVWNLRKRAGERRTANLPEAEPPSDRWISNAN